VVAARIDIARLDSLDALRPVLRGLDGRLETGPLQAPPAASRRRAREPGVSAREDLCG